MQHTTSSILFASIASPCLAQSAARSVTHNDPDGLVNPGQTVQIRAVLAYSGFFGNLWEVRGHLRSTADLGSASNNAFPGNYPLLPLTIIDPGDPHGGSVENIQIRSGEMSLISGFPGQPSPPWQSLSLAVLQYDWTAPLTPGLVEFTWTPDAALPNAWYIAPFISQAGPIAVATTYSGTSLIVVPAPATALLGVAGLALVGGVTRRR